MIVLFKKTATLDQIKEVASLYQFKIEKQEGNRYWVEMPNRGWLNSPDLEDLSEEKSVEHLLNEDGSVFYPRG